MVMMMNDDDYFEITLVMSLCGPWGRARGVTIARLGMMSSPLVSVCMRRQQHTSTSSCSWVPRIG
eukprot:10606387-Karenia_brevis.AAC.1